MSVIETLHTDHAAYVWLEKNGYEPIGAYGKYVIVTINGETTTYKTFREAAKNLGWGQEK